MTRMSGEPGAVEPDTKDWTWVLDTPCPECGFDAAAFAVADLPSTLETNAFGFTQVLAAPGATERPDHRTWSPLEYSCHVRDVHRIFEGRVRLMLAEDDPQFANWDQDETAVEERYDLQDPVEVSRELVAAAADVAAAYAAVEGEQWQRPGRRSNGSVFTIESLGRYHLHDVVHHLWDVGFDAGEVTRASYEASAADYQQGTDEMTPEIQAQVDDFVADLPAGARVLEIGSGGGRDARALEAAGASVRCTDITEAFVEILRSAGFDADLLDPARDDLADPQEPGRPYEGVWAAASLIHVERYLLDEVLRRLASATRPGGLLQLGMKEGDGEEWSTHGHVAGPRRFVYWREQALRDVLTATGWRVTRLDREVGVQGGSWLELVATRIDDGAQR
jgi:SAM-dependent methyltransferase